MYLVFNLEYGEKFICLFVNLFNVLCGECEVEFMVVYFDDVCLIVIDIGLLDLF